MIDMQPPLFSIVTVCLNPGKDLDRTVESVLSQDFDCFEYVIKDGLSQDGTRIFDCSDARVRFVSQPDRGIYDAMNQALGLCRGQYVNFLNAGDTFRVRNALSAVADCLEAQDFPDLVYVNRYNEMLEEISHYPPSLSPWFLFRKPVCHQAEFVKRSALLSIGGFDTGIPVMADYDALLKLVLNKKVRHGVCPIVAVNYQDDGNSSNPKNHLQKMREHQQFRRTYFTWMQRILFGIAYHGTLPGIRMRLMQQGWFRWLRRLLLPLTNLPREKRG